MSQIGARAARVAGRLERVVGRAHVFTDAARLRYYSQDIYGEGVPVCAVVRPGDTGELARVVAAVTAEGCAVIARGGGMSYTGGYLAVEEGTVAVDLTRMNRVLEIDCEDMYVRVECGCTWKALADALAGTGLRPPFWGTLSGIRATVGGGLSQNAVFWGSGRAGTAADAVVGLEVVLADGSVVVTGSGARRGGEHFFRHYGPDLTGLFTGDCGALGIKATATLRLVPVPTARRAVSFDFADHRAVLAAMSGIAHAGLAAECFGFDPFLQRQRAERESLLADIKALAGVVRGAGSVGDALREGARVALAGRRSLDGVAWSLHAIIEERDDEAADAALAGLRALCRDAGGREIEAAIPTVLRANPFMPLNNVIGPRGERWVPVHGIVPHSRAVAAVEGTQAVFAANEEAMRAHEIGAGFLLATVGTNGIVVEPVFFWRDALGDLHRDTVEPRVLRKLEGFAPDPAARAAVAALRTAVIDALAALGAVHLQLGKAYPYRDALEPGAARLIEGLKRFVDPAGRMNPGALGFDAA